MKIYLTINGNSFTATLEDNETTRELLKKLPLEVSMSELNGNEKYYYFDESFPTNSYRPGNISTGDIMLYGNDCLVIFYEEFDNPYSYTRIGKIDKPKKFVRVASGSTPPPNDPLDIYKKPFNKAVNNIITYVVNTCKKF